MNAVRKSGAVCLAFAVAFYTLPLQAAESGEKAGLPQLDTSHFPEQLFWLAISFAILYVLMAFVALPGVKRTQDKRMDVITTDLAAATAANEAAKAMMEKYEKALADARAKAQATMSEISTQVAKEAAERQHTQQQDIAKRLRESESRIAASRDAAIKNVQASAAELAGAIVEKITGPKVKA